MAAVMPPNPAFDGSSNGQPPSSELGISSSDFSAIRGYLAMLLPPVMAATRTDLEKTLFSDDAFEAKVAKFAMDGGVNVAYVTKERVVAAADAEEGDESAPGFIYSLHLPPVPSHTPNLLSTLSLIKSTHTLDLTQPLGSQLHFVHLSNPSLAPQTTSTSDGEPSSSTSQAPTAPGGTAAPYEGLHSVVHWGVTPWFESYVNSKGKGVSVDGVGPGKAKSGGESQMGIPVAKRKFAELELSLLHLQQNVEIPEPHLVIQPAIQSAVDRCRASGTRVTVDAIQPASLLTDTPFLNRLQADVNLWIRSIQAVTKLTRDVSSGTASQEINFWLSKERALEAIDAQLNGDAVQLVLDTLKAAKRYHATTSFLADTGLRESQDQSAKYNALMRDFPLNELLSATDLEKIRESLFLIFGHVNKKLRVSPYPLRRTLPLVEAISNDFNEQCLKVLGGQRLMFMDHATFERTMQALMGVFDVWEENIKEFTNVAREVMRKRSEKFIPVKINSAHQRTQEQVVYLRVFRNSHEQLQAMTGPGGGLRTLGGDMTDIDMEAEVKMAYEYVKAVDVLDTSPEGHQLYQQAEESYNDRVARVENQIISALRDKLATARNAHEMFRAFSKFNSLFVRPKIRGAIQEYQTRLIDSVKVDIKLLQKKFTDNYRNSEAYRMSQMRDLPPVASAIIWARQIERQLNLNVKRVEDVLGSGWESYAEGEKLRQESDAFRSKLDVRPIYDAWVQDVTRAEPKLGGRLLEIQRQRGVAPLADGTFPLELAVNFDSGAIVLFKEVRNLLWLNFPVPHAIITYAKEAKRVYPHAVSLIEAVRAYNQTCDTIDKNESIAMLVANYRLRVQELIGQGLQLRWEDVSFSFSSTKYASMPNGDRHEDPAVAFFRDFAHSVAMLQDKTALLEELHKLIEEDLARLKICPYGYASFAEVLGDMQAKIDKLNLEAFVSLDAWVAGLDRRVAEILGARSKNVLREWSRKLQDDVLAAEGAQEELDIDEDHEDVKMSPVTHELRMRNQVIYLDPPLEMTHSLWLKQCRRIFAIVCGQQRLRSSRYDMTMNLKAESAQVSTYAGLLVNGKYHPLREAVEVVHQKLQTIKTYVEKWLQFQSLWDLNPEAVYERLGNSLEDWAALLLEIRQTRSTFDTVTTEKSFGVCVVDYATIQSKVNAKYDAWQRDILSRYGQKLGTALKDVYAAIGRGRRELERRSVDTSSTAEAVSFITFVEDLKRKRGEWAPNVQSFQEGQRTLERQRYAFGEDWLHSDQVLGEWNAFNEILTRKDSNIQEQIAGLQLKILAEDGVTQEKMAVLEQEWNQNKPIQGSVKPDLAIETIAIFESRVDKLKADQDLVLRAKEALRMAVVKDERLQYIGEEAKDLKAVWLALSATWTQLGQLRDTPWATVDARKVRRSLDGMAGALKELPSRMRQYAAYEYAQEHLRSLGRVNALLTELKGESMRDRHWQHLFKALKVGQVYRPSNLSLGLVYDFDLKRNEKLVKDVVTQAVGEYALESYLQDRVRGVWEGYALELVNYQTKCRLIRGWDDLFAQCRDNLSSLSAIQSSPHYRVFQEEASMWEDRLNKIHVLFDVWIDVQRQWVYLEGIFTGNADIKQLLPVESSRFNNINAEFMAAMKNVYKSTLVLDVVAIPNIQKTFEKLAGALAKIQKALGEYLERERSAFPRFYFLGDEDLLEIIGNAKDVPRIVKHLKKMFAGIASVTLSEDDTQILSMVSRDDEEVPLTPPVVLSQSSRVNEWLSKLEGSMKSSLAMELVQACKELDVFYTTDGDIDLDRFMAWLEPRPVQIALLAVQIAWTRLVEARMAAGQSIHAVETIIRSVLEKLSSIVLTEISLSLRRKCEHLITDFVHQRDVLRVLIRHDVSSVADFDWLQHMRYYLDPTARDVTACLTVKMADASFVYGFEYLGAPDPLVQTPLTDRCYLTLTQALHNQLGGSPFGPAGTGKTESVKALGNKLGRFVLVFCCDEGFDFQAMGRIFLGISRVGAWGCFDEFNRLEERILSAVSQQIQTIQQGLAESGGSAAPVEVDLLGKRIALHPETGIFITMNPGYAGRSNLPDNLKKLFRSVSMTRPDRELIAQVMLFSQGFSLAETLASKVVPLFRLCEEQLSKQSHYDFGLRALKSVLVRAGMLKRAVNAEAAGKPIDERAAVPEEAILIRSIQESVGPKLYNADSSLLAKLVEDIFPGVVPTAVDLSALLKVVNEVCAERFFVPGEAWLEKLVQLYQVQQVNHGVMLVGPEATGKTQVWTVLLESLKRMDGIEGVSYSIDPKALDKEKLYGVLDNTTREWTDGLVTHIVRRIIDNARGESQKRHWIVFDGDVDPEWVENLNSVLDDNKLLTLPNGERLAIPPNVRFLFEVESLRYATLATVSRCGMIWFHEAVLTEDMVAAHHLRKLNEVELVLEDESASSGGESPMIRAQRAVSEAISGAFEKDGVVTKAMGYGAKLEHIMTFSTSRTLETLFSLINQICKTIAVYNLQHPDFPLSKEATQHYTNKRLLLAILWAVCGDSSLSNRLALSQFLVQETGVELPPGEDKPLVDFDVELPSGAWKSWQSQVPEIQLETHQVLSADVVIPTSDTIRHEDVLYSWVSERKPLILCGPPGSGKTMTLFSALRKLPDVDVAGLNFSSATSPELVLKTFEQYCQYRKTPTGTVLAPEQPGKWLIIFCDEINLPSPDKYGTQRVISFIRQMVEAGGFWRASDLSWVKLERIQFVGACNPPTDPGRTPMSQRFLRHAPVLLVDYPGPESLVQIYSTLARAALKVVPNLRSYAQALTTAMVELFLASRKQFTAEQQAHYIYSPRELTRWIRGIYEALQPLETLDPEGLVRIWAHEAQRLFQDRLVHQEERDWTENTIDEIAAKHFAEVDRAKALARPILFSNWMTKDYLPVDRDALREFTKARLRTFYEEELDVPLVLFDAFLDHVLRIDRVFRQSQGHVLMIGVSGSGKTTMSRFVAWMNGLSVFQIKVSNRYTAEDFDDDLKEVLRRAGCKGEKICFILDESNILETSFLERMNTLLANAEVPGLFEGDEYTALMTACREGAQREGLMLDTNDELYRWFNSQIARNLHVVFTMNPPMDGLADKAATSPALFNRCVLDWFGNWSEQALYQVASELTSSLDLGDHEAITKTMVEVHGSVEKLNARLLQSSSGNSTFATPRHFLEFLQQFNSLFQEKRAAFEDQQRHVGAGLDKITETAKQVEGMGAELQAKEKSLAAKDALAKEKLSAMVVNQQAAENKKKESLNVQAKIDQKGIESAEKKAAAETKLATVRPMLEAAHAAVGSLKKQQLAEMTRLSHPPEAIRVALEAACILLGKEVSGWSSVTRELKGTFTSDVQNFEAGNVSVSAKTRLAKDYVNSPQFTTEAVYKASRACAPLVDWVKAQLGYAAIMNEVGPLQLQIDGLERESEELERAGVAMRDIVAETEAKIEQFKQEYAELISETQAIRTEMERVKDKVQRSQTLLASLSSEQERWDKQNKSFAQEILTIPGDVLVSSAFLAYAGFYDQAHRNRLIDSWTSHLAVAGVKFRPDLSLLEYLSTPDQRAQWLADKLPDDQVCLENSVMLNRFGRYPFIIDPSRQADEFLMNSNKSKKMIVTSFLDSAFSKNLESALRFGTPIYVRDVEKIDPVLNTVLNREIRRTGGRQLIRLGNQDIDFSPSFSIYLSTRDADIKLGPDVCSRVTMVNFSLTPASLQTQSLAKVLKAERPETEARRRDLHKLQGEFKLKLRHLEQSLLQALSESTGNILEDDEVLRSLEKLKTEAAAVTQKMLDTDTVMQEVELITAQYLPIARACSMIYSTLEKLAHLDHFYRYSLQYFLRLFEHVILHNPALTGNRDHTERARIILRDLITEAYRRTATTLRQKDRAVLAGTFVRIFFLVSSESDKAEKLRAAFGGGSMSGGAASQVASIGWATEAQRRALASLAIVVGEELYTHMSEHEEAWQEVHSSGDPESILRAKLPDLDAISRVAVIAALRPDRLEASTFRLTEDSFGANLATIALPDLASIVEQEIDAGVPLVLCALPGHDASYRVEALVKTLQKSCEEIAMGSEECFGLADQALSKAARLGTWVLLKNTHLTPSWLDQLHKRLGSLNPQPNFRLFLTMEMHPKIPTALLQSSRIIMTEPAPGLKAGLIEALGNPVVALSQQWPMEGTRLLFLLAWFHAVLQERRRFAPLGWTKPYEFNDSDLSAATMTLHHWLKAVAKGRSNIDPKSIPWKAVRLLLKQAVYGGRIDVDHDQRIVDAFVDSLFRPEAYEAVFPLVPGQEGQLEVRMPEATTMLQFKAFVATLPEQNSCVWLGLPKHSEEALAHAQGQELLAKLRRFQDTEDEESDDLLSEQGSAAAAAGWKKTLEPELRSWLDNVLPEDHSPSALPFPAESALARFWTREFATGKELLALVKKDIQSILAYCKGEEAMTNKLKAVIDDLVHGDVPKSWQKYRYRSNLGSSAWISDLAGRLEHMRSVTAGDGQGAVQLGKLLNPEAWLTATQQTAASRDGVALEALSLVFDVDRADDAKGFAVDGLLIQGGYTSEGILNLNDGDSVALKTSQVRWTTELPKSSSGSSIALPVFLDGERKHQLFSIDVPLASGLTENRVLQSGCVFVASA